MGFRRLFVIGLAWRSGLLLLAALTLGYTFSVAGLGASRLLAAALCVAAVAGLWRYIQRTNIELARFIDAVCSADLSQNFFYRQQGSGFGEFGEALEQGIRRLREERHRLSDDNRFYEAVLDDAPIPLLIIGQDGRVELANKASRRLLTRHMGVRTEDFRDYGEGFADFLANGGAGQARLLPLMIDGIPQMATVNAAVVHRLGGTVKAVAVQPIQGELNAVEIAAQSDLIRVLTHEIMNSITPVTSLAQTATKLMEEADRGCDPAVADARAAVETLARRAEGVMHFVHGYRQISRTPEVRRRVFELRPWADEVEALFRASFPIEGLDFSLSVAPEQRTINADPDLLLQVLINLLRNAADAAVAHSDRPCVSLSFAPTRGGKVLIEVADNGPGIPEALRQDIFLPFFTTKAEGSGIGLSLARQVVLAHGGSITPLESAAGGALFRIVI